MKVFFTSSLEGKKQFQDCYDSIIETLAKNRVEVISREIQEYESLLNPKSIEGLSPDEIHYKFVKKGISLANAVVIEASLSKFQLGHEATLALLYNKPVLCVSQAKDYSIQIKHPKFYAQKYKTKKDLEVIIKDFVDELENKYLSVRFNAFLSPEQKTFLDWYGERNKMNASEVVRELIDRKMQETPEFYDEMPK